MSTLTFAEQLAPNPPTAGKRVVYFKADGFLYTKNSAGVEVKVNDVQDASITQAKLAAGVAGNGPSFSVYATANQSLTNGVFTKMVLDAEEFDTAGVFDSAVNYRFTPNVPGYYIILANVIGPAVATGVIAAQLRKNGAVYKSLGSISNSVSQVGTGSAAEVFLDGIADYAEIFIYQDSGSTQSTLGGAAFSYAQGFLARAA